MSGLRLVLAGGLALAGAASAAANPRTLDVLPSMTWKHARTGLAMGPYLGSLPRNEVGDFGTEEADIFLQYRGPDGTAASIFLFHPGIDSVPLWFDRVLAQIATRKGFGIENDAAPKAFAVRPGAPAASLRVTYAMHGGDVTATAAAVVPVADWLVVVRLSSPKMDAAALDAELSAVLNDISWPADKLDAPAAVPIKPCAQLPSFRKARLLKPDMAQALMGSLIGAAASDDEKTTVPTYCRAQQEANGAWGVYPVEGAEKGYVLALADAGRAIGVQPSVAALINKSKPAYSLTFMDLTQRQTYPDVSDQLPPEQALDIVNRTSPIASATTLGGNKSITISSGLAGKK